MKFYLTYTLILFGILISCTEQEDSLPDYLIERGKMVEVISEIELTQALIKIKGTTKDTISSQKLYNQVFEEFDISEEQFTKSLAFYCNTPIQVEGLYLDAIERLSERQAEEK